MLLPVIIMTIFVFFNMCTFLTDPSNEKRQNANNDSYQLSQMKPKYTVAVEELWDYVLRGKCTKSDMKEQFDVS